MEPRAEIIFKTQDKKADVSSAEKTLDGFHNFAARLGVTPRGECEDNLVSKGHYEFNLVTRNRIQLEAAYRGSWIAGRVIDSYAKDMCRAGIQINTNEGAEQVQEVNACMSRLQIWQSVNANIRWGRLYGGSVGVLQIEGQQLIDPLDTENVRQGQFQGIAVYDRWQIYPALEKIINSGPNMGLPEYYDIVLGTNLNDPGLGPDGQHTSNATGKVRVHYSRCIRAIGIELPFWQAITEMMWGESVLERMWDRLISFDTASLSASNLITRAQLRTVGIDGLREILAAGGKAEEALIAQFEYMRKFQQNEGISLLDKNDTFASTAYTFSGLSDMLLQKAQEVSGSAEIPLVVLFGQSPAGLNATGESDLRLYYDGINANQEATLRNPFESILKVLWRSVTGEPVPKDMTFSFNPLWQMSALDKANIAKTNTDTVVVAHQEGAIDTATMMKELKQSSGNNGIFTHISDEMIEEAQNEEPPMPDAPPIPGESTGDPAEGPSQPKAKAGDSAWRKFVRVVLGES